VANFHFGGGIAEPGDGGAGEVQGVFVKVEDGFYDVGIQYVSFIFYGGGHASDGGSCIFEEGADGGVDDFGFEERFVALDVDEDLAIGVSGDLGYAFGAGTMFGAGHARLAAEGFNGFDDAMVIGGDNDAGGKLGKFGAFVDALNHAGTSQRYQGFTGQAGGTVASWDNDDDVGWAHKNFPLRQNGCTKLHFVCNKFLCAGCYHAQRLCYLQELFYKFETLEDSFVLVIISASGRLQLSFQFSSHRAAVPAGRDDRGCRETRTLRS
jgi:hypothetical protein